MKNYNAPELEVLSFGADQAIALFGFPSGSENDGEFGQGSW